MIKTGSRINFRVANTIEASDAKGKHYLTAKLQFYDLQKEYGNPYLNHKEIYIYTYIHTYIYTHTHYNYILIYIYIYISLWFKYGFPYLN